MGRYCSKVITDQSRSAISVCAQSEYPSLLLLTLLLTVTRLRVQLDALDP